MSETPKRALPPPLKWAGIVLWVVITLTWIAVEITRPSFEREIAAERIQHFGGYRYQVPMKNVTGWRQIFSLPSDGPFAANVSRLQLQEDGRPIGPAHASHSDIADNGEGRFSHWQRALVFSASDNTDPRVNGRAYTVRGTLEPHLWMRFMGALGLLAVVYVALLRFAPGLNVRSWVPRSALLFAPAVRAWPAWAVGVGAALFFLLGLGLYALLASSGLSNGAFIAGYFPISDASGYWGCANEMLEYGQTDSWCHRRPLYSMMLAGIALIAGRSLELTLFLQAGLFCVLVFIYAREVMRWLGPIAAVLAAYVMILVGWDLAIGATMSEMLGLSFGLLAAAILLRGGEQRSLKIALLGLFVFGLGQYTRPGALFAMPLVLLWVVTLNGFALRAMARALALGVAALAAGFVVHTAFVAITGGDPTTSYGNTPTTIYGLSVGRNWTALEQDHPELVAENAANTREIYRIAFENIRAQPAVAFGAVIENLKSHLDHQWVQLALPQLPGRVMFLVTLCLAAWVGRRSPRALLAAAVAAGEFASSGLIENDAGMRLWSASGPVAQLLPPLLTLTLLMRWLAERAFGPPPAADAAQADHRLPRASTYALTALGVLIVLPLANWPFTPRGETAAPAGVCAAGLHAYNVDLREAAMMTITDAAAEPQLFPRRVSRDDMPTNAAFDVLYGESVRGLNEIQLVRVVVEAPRQLAMPGYFAPADMMLPREDDTLLCVDTESVVTVASYPFHQIVSARPLER